MKQIKTFFYKKRLYIILILLAIFLPVVIIYIFGENDFFDTLESSDWMNFIGAYTGGIISLIGVIITIIHTADQSRKDRILQVKPVFEIKYVNDGLFGKNSFFVESIGIININFKGTCLSGKRRGMLVLSNIGVGTALNFSASIKVNGEPRASAEFIQKTMLATTNSVKKDSSTNIPITILTNHPSAYLVNKNYDRTDERYQEIQFNDFKKFNITIAMQYEDILKDIYQQTIELIISPSSTIEIDNGVEEMVFSVHLKSVTAPEIVGVQK